MAKRPSPIVGRWRIIEMPDFETDYVDADGPAYIEFARNGHGEFQFGLVHGIIDYRLAERDGLPAVEWSWAGNDEMDLASGRGWAPLEADGTLRGRVFIHQSDDHEFVAKGRKPLKLRRRQ